jgi:hypothetical protein
VIRGATAIMLSISVVGLTLAACAPRGGGMKAGNASPGTSGAPAGSDAATSAPAKDSQVGSEAPIESGVLGRLLDGNGKPVEGASVGAEVLDANSGPIPEIGVLTDANGDFHWPLRPGRYRLTPYVEGVRIEPQEVRVEAGKATRVTFTVKAP